MGLLRVFGTYQASVQEGRPMPLRSLNSKVQVHSDPEGLSFWMAAGERRIRVFATFMSLHNELDGYSGPLDQFHGRKIFDEHRKKIEAAASRKYDAEGVQGELDGAPALVVTAGDLVG
jgi:hypothetical protein